jgi:oxygen-dependent protoporphyrinogen oxidase
MPAKYALQSLRRIERDQGSLLRAALKRIRDGDRPPAFSFAAGLQRLPEALSVKHEEAIRFDSPVETVRDTAGGFELELATETVSVDAVVVTAPASEAGEILQPVTDGADRLQSLRYNPLAIVHLESDYRADGYGYQIRRGEGFKTLGVTWNASLFDRDGLYTCFLGGMHSPRLIDRPESELGQLARDEFEAITDGTASVIDVRRSRDAFPAYDTSWEGLEQVTLPPRVHLATNYTSRLGIPARVREARTLANSLA